MDFRDLLGQTIARQWVDLWSWSALCSHVNLGVYGPGEDSLLAAFSAVAVGLDSVNIVSKLLAISWPDLLAEDQRVSV